MPNNNFANADNPGSGFAIDDDFDDLLTEAEAGEEHRENGSEFNPTKPVVIEKEEDNSDDILDDPIFNDEDDEEEVVAEEENQNFYVASEPNNSISPQRSNPNIQTSTPPQKQPEPPVREPEPIVERQESPNKRLQVPSMNDEISKTRIVIRVLDAYRALTPDERTVVGQFITNGSEIETEEEFVVRTMNVDRNLGRGMKQIKEAKALVPFERAFYVVELDRNDLYNVGNLVSIFFDEGPNRNNNSTTQYAREVASFIEALDSQAMKYIDAIQTVLGSLDEE